MRTFLFLSVAVTLLSGCATRRNIHSVDDIPIIDTHIHLYDTTRPQGLPWPPPEDTVLYRPILTENFDAVAEENGIAATVIVEASEWLDDNRWVLDLVRHNPDRYIGLVGSLEIGTTDFEKNLKELSKDSRFVGIRLRQRPRGAEFFNDDVWRNLKLLADMDQTLDVLMFDYSLADVDLIAKNVPHLRILINHVTGVNIDGQPVDPEWIRQVREVAENANVHCKISGLYQQSNLQPSPRNVEFYKLVLDVLWQSFGEDRLIYGSNWPVTLRGGDYASYKSIIMDYFEPKGRTALEKLLFKNALKFYDLPPLKQ